MECDPLKPAYAERRESVLVFEPAELSLHGCPSTVEIAPATSLTRDERVPAVSLDPLRLRLALPGLIPGVAIPCRACSDAILVKAVPTRTVRPSRRRAPAIVRTRA